MPLPKQKTERELNYLKKTYLISGFPKCGKSTIASQFGDEENKILFFNTEPGLKFREVYKWYLEEKVEQTNTQTGEISEVTVKRDPYMWEHFKTCVMEMTRQNDFKCLVVDTADNLFSWCQSYVRKRDKIQHESEMAFGRGYDALKTEFAAPIQYLSQKNYGIIFISHSKESDVEEKGRKFKKIDSSLPNTAKKVIQPLADYMFYFHIGDNGERLIRTKATSTVVAGDRSGILPEIIPMNAEILIKELSKPVYEVKQQSYSEVKNEQSI